MNMTPKSAGLTLESKTPLRNTKSPQTETKKSIQRLKMYDEAQLAVPLKGTNLDNVHAAVGVAETSKILMDAQEHPVAQNEIGLAFLQVPTEFLRSPTDREAFDGEAFRHFRLAAKNDNKEGQNNLGFVYENGIGVDKSIESAIKWYRKAANQGLEVAKSNLERLTYSAPGNTKVSDLLQRLEGKENSSATSNLGLIYGNTRRIVGGNGVNKPTHDKTSSKPAESTRINSGAANMNKGPQKNNMY